LCQNAVKVDIGGRIRQAVRLRATERDGVDLGHLCERRRHAAGELERGFR
jgi:hypothetical protein